MGLIRVDKKKCQKDGVCIAACPIALLAWGDDGFPAPVSGAENFCASCGHCVTICPRGAMENAKIQSRDCVDIDDALSVSADAGEQFLKARRSVRIFKKEPVARRTLNRLLDIVRYAPTAVNLQPVNWIIVEDPKKTRALAGTAIEWMRKRNLYPIFIEAWDKHGRDMLLRGAPHIAAAHARSDALHPVEDCAIALTYMMLAAEALGLGACWAGAFNTAVKDSPTLAKALSVPSGHTVAGTMMLGVPKYRHRQIPPRNDTKARWITE